ncbi:hypothetical protein C0Q70_03127 [Pomacea canaliculata]|uniref:Guanylate cyclase n=1 Tax=Pomacea canaliculata TaxID=400727 RepID=A0A2T7PRV2_POMCA|nr:hypothetical protein C0Q70_03127 [Pomacea canaliculata]
MLVDWRPPVAGGTSTIADTARSREQTEVTQRKRLTEAGQVLFDVSREVTSIHPHGMLNSSKHSGYDQERMSTKKQAPVSLKKRHSPTKLHLNVVFLLPAKDFYLFSYKHVLPAFDVAKNKFLHDVNITVRYNDTKCNSRNAPIALFDFYSQDLVDVVFGPVCDFSLAPVARYTPVWNVPVITSGGFAHDFDEKQKLDSEYNTLTRMGPNFSSMSEYILHLLKTFGWKKLQLLYDQAGKDYIMEKFCFLAASTIIFSCKMKKTENDFHLYIPDSQDIGKMLTEKVGLKYSVVVLCASPDSVREIMIKAHELNFDNGEYVFFNIDLFSSKNDSQQPWYREHDTPERNAKARKAFEALMTVTLRKPTSAEYRRFSEEVKHRAAIMYPNFTYGEEEVNSFVGAFHDAVLLYALALNETLAANGSVSDGAAITKRMWNRTFEGITGNVSIDANGDRNADYSLLDLNPQTGKFEVVANYYGNKKRYEAVPGKSIHWAGGRTGPPPDTPVCGFDGSKCPPEEPFPEYGIVIIVLGSILIIVIVAVFFIYSLHMYGMSLCVRLCVEIETELHLPSFNPDLSGYIGRNSYASSASGDTIAFHLSDAGNRQLFTKTGYYKVRNSFSKTCCCSMKETINLIINLFLFTQMKDLQNDHIVRFIGACIDYPNQCILTEYCPKGSLQDVLENDQIKLDWMFRYSIMQDIVRGMAYLNGTDIRSHGNLKSTNCVVDSRFVVKITDFGLHYFRSNCDAVEEENAYRNFHSQLWTAPELLRMHSRPLEGTLKVMSTASPSFARKSSTEMASSISLILTSHPRIYLKVKNGVRPYFRPTLEEYDCPCDELADVIRRCWAEDPSDRPDFTQLKSIIRKLNRDGDKGNILDNLLSRMEQYANNLEALVEERTADYLQQKKKQKTCCTACCPGSYEYRTRQIKGDAYMVVSGLPERNGDLHAREIARMSLSLLDAVMSFRIRHRPKEQLKLRIGIHTGPVCTGVVGHKMPRYCLFGDTVNTASRMESNGLPLRIHVSPASKVVLDRFGTFELESRGEVEMKGKGLIHTYWLLGERTLQDSPATTLNIL